MTPIRAKRTPKAPTRFSSGNDRAETMSSAGETILDYNDNTTKTTHTLSPISKANRLKTAAREPLKVKLPKLRRISHAQPTKETSTPISNSEIKIHKIKLPSLLSKKSKNADAATKAKSILSSAQSSAKPEHKYSSDSCSDVKSTSSNPQTKINSSFLNSSEHKAESFISAGPDDVDASTTSKPSQEDKSIADTSFNSSNDGESAVSGMKIVVSQPDASSGSEIRCPCGVDDDLGVMVECERCSTWQHGHCINVGLEDDAYEGYICAYCSLPRDRFRESLIQLTVGDKFQARFDQLESLIKKASGNADERNDMIENGAHLTFDELSQATKDLNRVLNSLRVKWKLLTSQAYELELRIWQNPYWTDEMDANSDRDKTFYFMDKCKRNLKLNIRNMIELMERRCRLIEYAIRMAEAEAKKRNLVDPSLEMRVRNLLQPLDTIGNSVREYKAFVGQTLQN